MSPTDPKIERFNSRYSLAVTVEGPKTRRAKAERAGVPATPAYKYFKVKSWVHDMEQGNPVPGTTALEDVVTEDAAVAENAGFSKARYWAQTSL